MEAEQTEKAIIVGAEDGEHEEGGLGPVRRRRVVGTVYGGRQSQMRRIFLGEGKLWELKDQLRINEASLAVFDDDDPGANHNLQTNCR